MELEKINIEPVKDEEDCLTLFKGLLGNSFIFDGTEIETICLPLIGENYFSAVNRSQTLELAGWIIKFWQNKRWSDNEVEEYQTQVMCNPNLDGVRQVFEQHPEVRRLFFNSPVPTLKLRDLKRSESIIDRTITNHNNNNEEEADRSLASLLGIEKEIGILSREETGTPRPGYNTLGKKRYKFISFGGNPELARDHLKTVLTYDGVIFKVNSSVSWDQLIKITKFDLLRSILCHNQDVIVRLKIKIYDSEEDDKTNYYKEFYLPKGVTIPFSEKLIPCSNEWTVTVEVLANNTSEESKITFVGMVVKQRVLEECMNVDPYNLGFEESSL